MSIKYPCLAFPALHAVRGVSAVDIDYGFRETYAWILWGWRSEVRLRVLEPDVKGKTKLESGANDTSARWYLEFSLHWYNRTTETCRLIFSRLIVSASGAAMFSFVHSPVTTPPLSISSTLVATHHDTESAADHCFPPGSKFCLRRQNKWLESTAVDWAKKEAFLQATGCSYEINPRNIEAPWYGLGHNLAESLSNISPLLNAYPQWPLHLDKQLLNPV
ncbi:hypothetical protein K474DRAFT_1672099, partial [Panus rudis PR-1116 ss-1]